MHLKNQTGGEEGGGGVKSPKLQMKLSIHRKNVLKKYTFPFNFTRNLGALWEDMLVSDSQSFPVQFGFPKRQNPSEFNFQHDGQVRSRFRFGVQCKIGNTNRSFFHSFDTRNCVVRPTKETASFSKFSSGGGGKPPASMEY